MCSIIGNKLISIRLGALCIAFFMFSLYFMLLMSFILNTYVIQNLQPFLDRLLASKHVIDAKQEVSLLQLLLLIVTVFRLSFPRLFSSFKHIYI
jgi:hypothetical protein